MQLGGTTVVTPYDNPIQYSPDWRNVVATTVVAQPKLKLPVSLRDDKWIKMQVDFLKSYDPDKRTLKKHEGLSLAFSWAQDKNNESALKYKLEPLLLTELTFGDITVILGGGVVNHEVFRLYEKIYFNIRDDEGAVHKSHHLRQYFALPHGGLNKNSSDTDIWRSVAVSAGHEVLLALWSWEYEGVTRDAINEYLTNEVLASSQSALLVDILSKRVNHFNLAAVIRSVTEHSRLQKESADANLDSAKEGTLNTLMGVLSAMAPKIYTSGDDEEKNREMTEAVQNRIAAQRNISAQQVEDKGKEASKDVIGKAISDQFKG